jgi:hypothetical protein
VSLYIAPVFLEFSLETWLEDRSLTIISEISDVAANDLIQELGLSEFMDFSDKCNLTIVRLHYNLPLYSPSVSR